MLNGYDIIESIGKPLSYWDYERVKKLLEEDKFYKEENEWDLDRNTINIWLQ